MREVQFGQFKHQVEILSPGENRTPSGDWSEGTLTVFATRLAAINGLTGRELVRARTVEAEVTHLVSIRSDDKVAQATPKMRIRFQDHRSGRNRLFEILFIRDIEEAGRVTEFMCKEQVA